MLLFSLVPPGTPIGIICKRTLVKAHHKS